MGDSWANLPPQILALLHVVNRIKELALTPKGAVEMAARMNQIQWLEQLLSDFECDVSDAVVEAAGVGRVDLLKILVPKRNIFVEYDIDGDPCFYDGESDDNDGFLADAAVAAAKHGHLEAVEFLVCKIYSCWSKNEALWRVLDEAAAHGHGDVLKIASLRVEETDYEGKLPWLPDRSWKDSAALSRAISGGHTDVVELLVDEYHCSHSYVWDIKKALEQAMKEDQYVVAERIYDIYPRFCNEIMGLSDDGLLERDDRMSALRFLCKFEFGVERIDDAFVIAIRRRKLKMIELLLNTGQVSSDVTGYAFVKAARFGSLGAVKFLYKNRRICPQSINKAFELAGSLAVMNFLFEKDEVALDAMAAAFSHATQPSDICLKSQDELPLMRSEDRIEIIKFLCDTGCIARPVLVYSSR